MNGPQAPDPYETAQAQSQWNTTTAQTQQALNMTNQVTPWGSLNYDQTGSQTIIGPDGRPISVPQYTATTSLSPEQQAIFDQTQQAQGNLAGLASDQSAFLRDYMADPFSFDNQDAADWAYDIGASRLNPELARREANLRTTLAQKGIREGSDAWNAEMARLTQAENDARNSLALAGRGMAFNEALATRNQPINEIGALLSGSQVSMPNFVGTPQTGVAGVDYAGMVQNNYNQQMDQHNAMMGGLFGLAGTIGGAGIKAGMFSDIRLKEDIRRVGTTDGGVPIYTYRYKGGGPVMMGVMAQDVPEARIMDPSGFYRVDYGRVQ